MSRSFCSEIKDKIKEVDSTWRLNYHFSVQHNRLRHTSSSLNTHPKKKNRKKKDRYPVPGRQRVLVEGKGEKGE